MWRRPLHDTIDKTFSMLIVLVNKIIGNIKDINQDAFHMLNLVCKIFYVVNHLRMCPHLMQVKPDRLGPWMQLFKSILDLPIPAVLSSFTDDPDQVQWRNNSIIWKMKGLVSKIVLNLFVKYIQSKKVKNNGIIIQFT